MNNEKQLLFHGDDVAQSPPESALFHIIPVPFEKSVSYGGGTAQGPQAVIESSCQLELLTNGVVPADYGVHTGPPVDCTGSAEEVLNRVEKRIADTLQLKKIPVLIGGEHTITCGIVQPLKHYHAEFGVIQFDAHADLRDTYEGTPLSHACVMRRIHEQGIKICQLGTRSYSVEERDYRQKHQIAFSDCTSLRENNFQLQLPDGFPEKVFITFDIDGLDSSLMPATGTPVPGGLDWHQAMTLIGQIMEDRICIGFDLVEFSPIPGFHAYSFTAAQLLYNIMGYLVASDKNRKFHGIRQ